MRTPTDWAKKPPDRGPGKDTLRLFVRTSLVTGSHIAHAAHTHMSTDTQTHPTEAGGGGRGQSWAKRTSRGGWAQEFNDYTLNTVLV